jgi:NTP pyrophosphatase (non-canonical NTP hydrolase)
MTSPSDTALCELQQNLHEAYQTFAPGLRLYSQHINMFMQQQGFWGGVQNTGEKIALMHSELSEALEADRKNLPSDKLPDFSGVEEELADTMIRILDFSAANNLRLMEAIHAKMLFNLTRPYKHGKRY